MKILNRIGEKYITNQGYEVEIVEYFNNNNCTVRFVYNNVLNYNIKYNNLIRGKVQNYYHKSIYGVGYIGGKSYNSNKNKKAFLTWVGVIKRCYDKKSQETNPTYKGCSVDKRWHNFQVFAEWFYENWKPYMKGWHLDKDILFKGNRIYSSETCGFVPREINLLVGNSQSTNNGLPIGVSKNGGKFICAVSINNKRVCFGSYSTPKEAFYVYKAEKEKHIKKVANEWKGQITEQIYEALINYRVEIPLECDRREEDLLEWVENKKGLSIPMYSEDGFEGEIER